MPTIKMSGGKVVTKSGKAACSCCEPDCCLYPSASVLATDLPSAITLRGVGSLSKSGTDYGNTTNGVILESGVYARYLGGVRSTSTCLFDGNGSVTPGNDLVEDQFNATYTFHDNYIGDSYTLPRIGLCSWELIYHDDDYVEPYTPEREYALAYVQLFYTSSPGISPGRGGWFLRLFRLEYDEIFDEELDDYIDVLTPDNYGTVFKLGDQTSPVGDYPTSVDLSTIS